MKKIIFGTLILMLSPFTVICGGYLLKLLAVNSNVLDFACIIGGFSIVANWIIALVMLIKGYNECLP